MIHQLKNMPYSEFLDKLMRGERNLRRVKVFDDYAGSKVRGELNYYLANQDLMREPVDLSGSRVNVDLSLIHLPYVIAVGADFSDARLDESNLMYANFERAKCHRTSFRGWSQGTYLNGANFREANLLEANLDNAYLGESDLTGANLRNVKFGNSILNRVLARNADFTGARLSFTVLEDGDFEDASFQDAEFYMVNLNGAKMRKANFKGAKLYDRRIVTFCHGTDFSGADFENAELRVDLSKANLEGAKNLDTVVGDWYVEQLGNIIFIRNSAIHKPSNNNQSNINSP